MRRHALSVLVLTEDSSADAHEVVSCLTRRAFQVVEERCHTHRIEWQPASDEARVATRGNLWKSRKRDRELRDLVRSIATKLGEGGAVPGFVVFHFDGDRPWSQRDQSENLARFGEIIEYRVRVLLAGHGLAHTVAKLIPLVPFYSIESWTYQNIARARQLCCDRAEHRALLDAWEADRASLDEVVRPKEALCLGDRYNKDLCGQGWPVAEVAEAGASFAAAVEAMRGCEPLVEALRATWETW